MAVRESRRKSKGAKTVCDLGPWSAVDQRQACSGQLLQWELHINGSVWCFFFEVCSLAGSQSETMSLAGQPYASQAAFPILSLLNQLLLTAEILKRIEAHNVV